MAAFPIHACLFLLLATTLRTLAVTNGAQMSRVGFGKRTPLFNLASRQRNLPSKEMRRHDPLAIRNRNQRGGMLRAAEVRVKARDDVDPDDISEADSERDGRARQLRRLSRRDPEKVVEFLIEALRTNVYNDGKTEPYAADDGLALLYLFSTIDPWKPSEYFGVKRDLGQFERFRLMMYSDPFKHLINHKSCEVIATARPTRRHFVQLLRVIPSDGMGAKTPGRKDTYFFFISLKQQKEGPHRGKWMPEKLFPTTVPETDHAWAQYT
mmetsp:Transcript_753/g.1110  ORF Transcript_753/g.1110 Transcript_753/m.1110 type:complete len:267 (-) Transcript_753:179-979(-)|eukprot:CAMPEP_0184486212 /NCGR_PEP_ID=MMETSP0113_2-20130426/7748_1 /TAXON_ID=91329 /ORGANISM="Norrisiella sphaerica, Strain BC52" /LENGTH=266 /DNA_ID=CAMNT_0026867989 /DNA_START=245 /DNA_END=1045 /DNA_ORIENTATION=+